MNKPRAYSKDESREQFLDYLKTLAKYWATCSVVKEYTTEERMYGLLHSILSTLDGCSSGFPCAIDLVLSPHPDDKKYLISEGENYYETGMIINECALHEMLYQK